jgi:N-carbamoylputrescine amidase
MPYAHLASQPVTVALVQMRCEALKQANVDKALARIAQAAQQGAQVVCLQELFAGPYFCQSEDHRWFVEAEPIPGPTADVLAAAARKHAVVVVGSLFERRAPGLYHNTAAVWDADGRLVGLYRKMHIPDDPYYYEKFYFTPGDLGFRSFPTRYGRIGVCVCWDQWYPEAARLTALAGAEILFYPTAIGWLLNEKEEFGASQQDAWVTMMRSHEGSLQFWGNSLVIDPNGNVLARAGEEEEAIVMARCDLGLIDVVRTHWPFMRDRRIDAYGDLVRRYRDEAAGAGPCSPSADR